MKKLFLCLMAVCLLSACDKNSQPECWDTELEKELAEATWAVHDNDVFSETFNKDIEYKAKQVIEIIEVPDVLKTEPTKQYNRLCNARITFENGETHTFVYVPVWATSKNSKTVKLLLIDSF